MAETTKRDKNLRDCILCNEHCEDVTKSTKSNFIVDSLLDKYAGDSNEVMLCLQCNSLCERLYEAKENLINHLNIVLRKSLIKQGSNLYPRNDIIFNLFEMKVDNNRKLNEQSQREISYELHSENMNSAKIIEINRDNQNDIQNINENPNLINVQTIEKPKKKSFEENQCETHLEKIQLNIKNKENPEQSELQEISLSVQVSHPICLNSQSNEKLSAKRTLKCTFCPKVFKNIKDFDIHVESHMKIKKFVCEICGVAYRHKKGLDTHISLHKGEARFECEHCKKVFTQKSGLQRHLPIHTGEMPFQCDECGRRFVHHTSFKLHKQIHNGQKEYFCGICKLAFFSNSGLRRHTKTHTGLKPFQCQICSKQFSEKYNLEAHTRTHSGKKLFICKLCTQGFNRKSHLFSHLCISAQ